MRIMGLIEALQGVKSVKKAWGEAQNKCLSNLKLILSNAPILEHPNWDREFIVATDASQFGIGAVLYQKDEGQKDHIIHLRAQSLTKGQKNYPATKRELLAMIAALKKWRHILLGRKFTVKVDHKGDGDERKYLIWWEGYPKSEATWESTNNIFNKLVIKEYWKKKTKSKSSSFSSCLPQ